LLRKLNNNAMVSNESLGFRSISRRITLVAVLLIFFIWMGLDQKVQIEHLISDYGVTGAINSSMIIFIIILLFIAARQKNTEHALQRALDELEVKVEQRTQELFTAKEKFKTEILRRRQMEITLKTWKEKLMRKKIKLATASQEMELAQAGLVQNKKMAGIGQLIAGVAHEINNPLGFITSNVEALEEYFAAFSLVLGQYRELGSKASAINDYRIMKKTERILGLEKEQDLDYILADTPGLLRDTSEGLQRISKIVKGMGLFSRVDQQQVFQLYDLNKGLENTIRVAHNEFKNNIILEENLGQIPKVEAIDGEINQVLLNLMLNGLQAIKEKHQNKQGIMKVSTWHDGPYVYGSIEDDGTGIEANKLKTIFNPFFTTKPVGQGTGMGLSISYEIIVNHHQGEIFVESDLGKRTKFTIKLPIKNDLLKRIKNSSR